MKFIKKLLKWVCTIISIGLIYQAFFGDEIIRWVVLVIGALFLIPWLITKIDNEYNMSEVLAKYIYLKENKVNAFSEEEYKKLLGANSTIIRESAYLFPLGYEIQTSYACTYTGMAGKFDQSSWNRDVGHWNDIIAKNKVIQQRYDDLMGPYQMALQTYNLAQQTRAQTVQQTSQKNKLLAVILTSGGSKPKKPTLKLLKLPKKPERDKYTKFIDKKTGNISRNMVNLNFCTLEYGSRGKFNNDHIIENDKDTFGFLIDSYMKMGKWKDKINKHVDNIEIDESIKAETISFSEKDVLKKAKVVNLSNRSDIESVLCNNVINDIKKSIDECNLPEIGDNIRLKDVKVEITKFSYKINATKFLPLQFVEYTNKKGKNDIKVLDFMSKYRIEIK
jgi:hypothetical protein